VIISSVAEVQDIRQTVSPDLAPLEGSSLLYIDFSKDARHLGGSSLAQVVNALGADVPTVRDAQYFAACFGAIQNLIRENQILSGHDISSGGLITTLLEMCFAVPGAGLRLQFDPSDDLVCRLFAENPGVVIQVANAEKVRQALTDQGIAVETLGTVIMNEKVTLASGTTQVEFAVAEHREVWFNTSYLFDKIQRPKGHADLRKNNLGHQPLAYQFQPRFNGTFATYGIDPRRRNPSGIKAAIIREKGVNGDREMAYALYLAGFDVKDVHMTDLVSGREDLRDVNLIVFVGGFSNSDVLGSAKGWAGAFLYNAKAKTALENFYNRPDTLSLGVCNGCQVMMELGLVYRELNIQQHPKMHHNGSGKFESAFINVTIPQNHSVMLQSYAGARLGVWLAHGEGRFRLPADLKVNIGTTFAYAEYPGNPNDSDGAVAALYSHDGRHLAIMPHIERSLFTWNWPHYPESKLAHEVSPWIEAFVNARDWVAARVK
ncbi:MAG: phosphoribosylformylglycinamidine synthase subunit PurQ, partial [Cyclobacteriaceae bacterium]